MELLGNRRVDGIPEMQKFAKVWEQILIILRLAIAERGVSYIAYFN